MGTSSRTFTAFILLGLTLLGPAAEAARAQDWQQHDEIFNPSGIPSLPFSQPRFADLDGDDDFDLILGSTDCTLLYYENIGTAAEPVLSVGPDIFAVVDLLDAEVGVCVDLDGDEDLDLVTGGYHGLVLFENTGEPSAPVFVKREGFFSGLATGANPIPTFADLDADDDFDLLIGVSESGALKYYSNCGTPGVAVFTESQSEIWFDIGLYAYPWLTDFDSDLDVDLLAGRDVPGFVYYRNDGDLFAWDWVPDVVVFAGLGESTYWNSPCLVDLNADDLQDLVYGTSAGPLQHYENGGPPTNPEWALSATLFGGVLDVGGASSPFLFDFDDDDDLDLVSGSQLGDIKYYENVGTSEAPAWQAAHEYFLSIDHSIYSAITLGLLDGDDLPDAVVGDLSGNLFYHHNNGSGFDYDGSVFAGINLGGMSVPRLVNMDGDGDLDLVVGNEAGQLHYFENVGDGTMEWLAAPGYFGGIDVGTDCSPTLADFDRDGDIDLLTGDLFHELQYFENVNGSWQEDPSVVEGLTAGQNAAPAFGDLDGDQDLDLTIGNYAGTFNYFENVRPTSDVDARPRAAVELTALRAHPNPFHPAVTLSFNLSEPAPVDLSIFDAAGRRVCQLLSGFQSAGDYAIAWDRRHAGGTGVTRASLSSGVYFCRLKVWGIGQTIVLTYLR